MTLGSLTDFMLSPIVPHGLIMGFKDLTAHYAAPQVASDNDDLSITLLATLFGAEGADGFDQGFSFSCCCRSAAVDYSDLP